MGSVSVRAVVATLGVAAFLGAATVALQGQEAEPTVWLCRPGLDNNPCDSDLTATLIDGTKTSIVTTAHPRSALPVDCFYVYPTVSEQQGDNADLKVEPAERQAAVAQASRFSSVCNV